MPPVLLLLLAAALALSHCSASRYRQSADREVYGILEQKSPMVPGMESEFSIEPQDIAAFLDQCPKVTDQDPDLGDGMPDERGCAVLSLENAVILATRGNRSYQSARESVFLKALNLTLDRHRYAPIFSGEATGNYNRSTRDATVPTDYSRVLEAWRSAVPQLEQLTGTPAALPLIRNRQAIPLGVTSAERLALLPDVPTMQEQGLAGFDALQSHGVVAPRDVPAAIVARLNDQINAALRAPETARAS